MDPTLLQNLGLIVAALVTAVILGQIIIPNILLVSFRKRLFDVPDERKVHNALVPRLGGLSFFPVILFCVCCFIGLRLLLGGPLDQLLPPAMTAELLLFTAGLTLLYIVGVADDLIGVRYSKKFVVQLLTALMLPLSGLYINNLYGLFGIHVLSPFIGVPLTLVLVVFITNAINLIDGIDGLASGLSMVALAVFGGLFVWNNWWVYALVAFVSIGVLIPFFSYNVFGNASRGRKIFMGDTGSLMLGYLLSLFTVRYCMYTGDALAEPSGSPVLVVTARRATQYLGELKVDFDEEGVPVSWSGGLRELEKEDPTMPAVSALIDKYTATLESFRSDVVGSRASGSMPDGMDACREGDCLSGMVTVDAMLSFARPYGAVIAVCNGGAIRAALPEGRITRGIC